MSRSSAPRSGLLGRWGFEEATGDTANDTSGHLYDGTFTGGRRTCVSGYGFPQDLTIPTAPQNLAAAPGNNSVALSWDPNGETDLAGYDVYRSTSSPVSTAGSPINGTDLVQGTTFTDTTAVNGTQYFYVVQAVDTADHHSASSNEKSATPNPFGGGNAVNLNGTNQYVRVVTPAAVPDALNLSTFTLETWFRQTGAGLPTSTGTGGIAAAIPLITRGHAEQETPAQDMNYFLGLDGTGHLVADFEEAAGPPTASDNHPVTGNSVATQNVWHHAAATYDGTTWRLYLDGRLDAKLVVGSVSPNVAGTHDVGIGSAFLAAVNGAADGFFQGDIDEVRIWSGARTGAQLRTNRDAPIPGAAAGLVGRWGFDEASGSALDTSGTGYDGTLQGATRVTGYTFPADTTAPGVPQNPVATPGSASVALTWDAVAAPDLAGYDVWRSTSSPVSTAGAPINGTDLVSGATFTDNTALNGTQYFYVVQAVDGSNNHSASSAEANTTPVPGDPIFVGAGDIAGTWPQDTETANLINALPGAAVFTLGDNAYNDGAPNEFALNYDPTWGQFKDRTRPAPGNHDFNTGNANGYFDYFNGVGVDLGPAGSRAQGGYYSYDLGTWHIVVLNSECEPSGGLWSPGGCAVGSPQYNWLINDLNTATTNNIIAMWHKPRISSASGGNQTHMQALWQVLYDHGADIVMGGHFHFYEQLAPLNANLQVDNNFGIRSFVVGTGGQSLTAFATPVTGSLVRDNNTWGVMKLTLHPNSYDWQFIPIQGQSFTDSGTSLVHGPPPDTTAPTVSIVSAVPSTLNPGDTGTNVTWNANENGTYTVRVGGTNCTTGTVVAGPTAYATAPANVVTNVDIANLAIGANTIRVCVTDGATLTGSATTTVTRNGATSTVTFRSVASATTGTTATSVTVAKPAGVVTGDGLLAVIDVQGAPAVTAPAGWTLVRTDSSTATSPSIGQTVYVHVAGAGEPASYTFSWTGARGGIGAVLAYSGVDPVNPIDVQSGAVANAATITAPSVTTTGTNRMIVALFGVAPDRTLTGPAGMTQRFNVPLVAVPGQKITSGGYDQTQAAAGASGGRTANVGTTGRVVGQLVALRPGTSGGGGPGPAAPIIDSVTVTPSGPATNATLTANVASHDPDPGDTVTVQYQWVNGATDITGATGPTLDLSLAGNGDHGDSITVRVRGTDGAHLGAPSTSSPVVVVNTAPTATVSLNTNAPLTDDTLTATATRADLDGDAVTLTYVWKVNGATKKTTAASSSLTDTFDLSVAGNGDLGDTVTVEVTPNDGTTNGATTPTASATVFNTPPPTPVVTFRSASSAVNTVATTLVLPKPAGVVAGDALLAVVDAQGAPAVTAPAGWALVRSDSATSATPSVGQSVYVHIAGASEPASYTFTLAAARGAAGGILAYDNVDNANPIDAHSGAVGAGTSIAAPAVTTSGPDRMIVGLFGIAPDRTTTPPAGMAERFEVTATSTPGQKVTSEAADVAQPVAGSTGAKTANFSGLAGRVVGQLVALRPG